VLRHGCLASDDGTDIGHFVLLEHPARKHGSPTIMILIRMELRDAQRAREPCDAIVVGEIDRYDIADCENRPQ
jgi:hypothetical protein